MDGCMQGGGARATKDGLNSSNIAGSTNTSLPNVETTEQRFPVLYLQRGLCADSEGAGKYRGGLAGELAMRFYDVERAQCISGYIGKADVTAPRGFAGGLPGTTGRFLLKRNTNVEELLQQGAASWDNLAGEPEEVPQLCPPFSLTPQDVWYLRCQGGGGYGHPYERDPELVRQDVARGYLSRERAREVYGVVLKPDSLEVDVEATQSLRQQGQPTPPQS